MTYQCQSKPIQLNVIWTRLDTTTTTQELNASRSTEHARVVTHGNSHTVTNTPVLTGRARACNPRLFPTTALPDNTNAWLRTFYEWAQIEIPYGASCRLNSTSVPSLTLLLHKNHVPKASRRSDKELPDRFVKITRQGQVSTDHAANFVFMSLPIQNNELGQSES